jgi:hypothetical protein
MLGVMVSYLPSPRLNVTFNFNRSLADTVRYAGNETDSYNLGFGLELNKALRLNGSLMRQNLRYLGQEGNTSSNIFNLGLTYQARKDLTFNFDFQDVRTANRFPTEDSADQTTDTTSSTGSIGNPYSSFGASGPTRYQSFGLNAQYRFDEKHGHNVFFRYRSDLNNGGYGDFNRQMASLGTDLRLTDVISLRLSYDFTDYANSQENSGSYTSSMFNAEVGVRF